MKIMGSRCISCERVIVPPRETCPYCGLGGGLTEKAELKNEGSILSYTVLEMPPEGFSPPLLLALVELSGGTTVLAHGISTGKLKIEIGTNVFLQRDEEGRFFFKIE